MSSSTSRIARREECARTEWIVYCVRAQLQTRHAASASRLRQGQRDSSDSIFELMTTLEKAEAHFGVTAAGAGVGIGGCSLSGELVRQLLTRVLGVIQPPSSAANASSEQLAADRERDLTRALRKLYGCGVHLPVSTLRTHSLHTTSQLLLFESTYEYTYSQLSVQSTHVL